MFLFGIVNLCMFAVLLCLILNTIKMKNENGEYAGIIDYIIIFFSVSNLVFWLVRLGCLIW